MSRESRSPRKRSRQDGKAQEQEDGSLAEDATSSAGFTSEGENGRKEQCSSCLELFCSEEIPLAAVSPQNSRILLTENQRVILSRALLVDLEEYVTQLSHISRIHAVVEFDRESRQYIVRDHSRNGTYVNGMRLPQAGSAILQHGDCILLLVKRTHGVDLGYRFLLNSEVEQQASNTASGLVLEGSAAPNTTQPAHEVAASDGALAAERSDVDRESACLPEQAVQSEGASTGAATSVKRRRLAAHEDVHEEYASLTRPHVRAAFSSATLLRFVAAGITAFSSALIAYNLFLGAES